MQFVSLPYIASSELPQGSNLGPLLFLVFIDDLANMLHCEKLLFVDDLKLYSNISCCKNGLPLQRNIDNLSKWCSKNRLVLNTDKCFVLTYSRRRNPIAIV